MNGTNMLIDTNIILEVVLEQENHKDCEKLLNAVYLNLLPEEIFITRFTLNAI